MSSWVSGSCPEHHPRHSDRAFPLASQPIIAAIMSQCELIELATNRAWRRRRCLLSSPTLTSVQNSLQIGGPREAETVPEPLWNSVSSNDVFRTVPVERFWNCLTEIAFVALNSFNIVLERRQNTIFKVFLVVCQIFHVLVTVFHQISGHYLEILERLVLSTVNVLVAILDLELFAHHTSRPPMLGGTPSRDSKMFGTFWITPELMTILELDLLVGLFFSLHHKASDARG